VKSYCTLAPAIKEAVSEYNEEVRSGSYPDKEHSFSSESNLRKLLGL